MNNDHKKVYAVLGMPRSGTSAIARSLEALGVYLGDNLIPPNTQWNAKGYFEDQDIVRQINKKVLNLLFDNWESIKILEHNQLLQPSLKDIRAKAINLINQRYGNQSQWGFKDPRTARLIPFWQSIFAELSLEDRYVIALRNPLASAHSFKNLTKIDLEKGLLLWLAHLIPAIDETQGKNRIVISYDLLMQNPAQQLTRLQRHFQLENASAQLEKYTQEFLDKKLKHYHFTDHDFKTDPASAVIPVGFKVYDLLLRVARDEVALNDMEFAETWKVIKSEFQTHYPLYSYMDTLLKKNKEYERQLRTINKSIPWKMVYPFRIIDNKLRALRHTLRKSIVKPNPTSTNAMKRVKVE